MLLRTPGDGRLHAVYLRCLMHLLSTKAATTDPKIIQQVFLKHLPMSVHFGLAACLDYPIKILAKLADRMMVVLLLDVNACFGRPTPSTTSDCDTELHSLREEVTPRRRQCTEHTSRSPLKNGALAPLVAAFNGSPDCKHHG